MARASDIELLAGITLRDLGPDKRVEPHRTWKSDIGEEGIGVEIPTEVNEFGTPLGSVYVLRHGHVPSGPSVPKKVVESTPKTP